MFTAQDMEGVRPIRAESSLPTYKPSDYPPLARGKGALRRGVRGPVHRPTRAEAEDIAEDVILDLEALPAVIDSLAARRPGAPRVHEEWGDNLFLTTSVDGDFESARKRAAVVVEREYRTARQCMAPMEGKAVLARHDERKGQLVVYTSTQVPHLIRTGLSQFLGLDQADVRVIAPDVGGAFGYKCVLQPEEISVSWAAMRTGRPLRWVEDRREHLTAGANTRQHHYRLTACADGRGRLLAVDAEITVDVGAYSVWPFTRLPRSLPGRRQPAGALRPRCLPLQDFLGRDQQTRLHAVSRRRASRGVLRDGAHHRRGRAGRSDGSRRTCGRRTWCRPARCPTPTSPGSTTTAAITRPVWPGARRMIGLDAVRARQGRSPPLPERADRPDTAHARQDHAERPARDSRRVDAMSARQGSPGPDGRLIGVGFSTFTEQTAHGTRVFGAWGLPLVPGYEQATVKLAPSGTVEVRSGNHSFGQGLETTLAQIASEQLASASIASG